MPIDVRDGYIHLSIAEQVRETAAKYFAGTNRLVLLTITANRVGADTLKWEVSRGAALFPHLYAPLDLVPLHSDFVHG